jgi:hypothetical protein
MDNPKRKPEIRQPSHPPSVEELRRQFYTYNRSMTLENQETRRQQALAEGQTFIDAQKQEQQHKIPPHYIHEDKIPPLPRRKPEYHNLRFAFQGGDPNSIQSAAQNAYCALDIKDTKMYEKRIGYIKNAMEDIRNLSRNIQNKEQYDQYTQYIEDTLRGIEATKTQNTESSIQDLLQLAQAKKYDEYTQTEFTVQELSRLERTERISNAFEKTMRSDAEFHNMLQVCGIQDTVGAYQSVLLAKKAFMMMSQATSRHDYHGETKANEELNKAKYAFSTILRLEDVKDTTRAISAFVHKMEEETAFQIELQKHIRETDYYIGSQVSFEGNVQQEMNRRERQRRR